MAKCLRIKGQITIFGYVPDYIIYLVHTNLVKKKKQPRCPFFSICAPSLVSFYIFIYILILSMTDYSCIVIDQIISVCNGYLGVRYEAYYM